MSVRLDASPITVAWEITRACPLRCRHCRAEAIPVRSPDELGTAEGLRLIDEIAALGARVLVITGGDPLTRPDVFDLIARGASRGLHVGFSPSVTPKLTTAALERAKSAGAGSVHLSLDGARPDVHDGLRGVAGSFRRTLAAMEAVRRLGLPLQIGTTVATATAGELPAIAELLRGRATVWSLFFLVPTGRGRVAEMLDANAHERVLRWLAETADALPYAVRTTAAPTYRRIRAELGLAPPRAGSTNDGKGFCFVSHTGEVQPSGFLPLNAGSVRDRPLAEMYRRSPLFEALRDPDRLRGKCGRCEHRATCGGSRARAYALTGDPLGADPTCAYQPGTGPPRSAPAVKRGRR